MHSLIREFLLRHREEVVPDWQLVVGRLALTLLDADRPDDLFLIASAFSDVNEVRKATGEMIGSVLELNRIEHLGAGNILKAARHEHRHRCHGHRGPVAASHSSSLRMRSATSRSEPWSEGS